MKAFNILWDTDDNDDVSLPKEIDLPDSLIDEEEISDYLSSVTGWCHNGFSLTDSNKTE